MILKNEIIIFGVDSDFSLSIYEGLLMRGRRNVFTLGLLCLIVEILAVAFVMWRWW